MAFSSSNVIIPILVVKLVIAVFCSGCDATHTSLPCSNLTDSKYLVSTQKVTWAQAYVLCEQYGMELASVTTQEEEDAIEALLNNYVTTPGYLQGYYTAGNRNGACTTEFIWFTNGKPVIYNDFIPAANNFGGNEDCIEIYLISKGNYAWNDLACSIRTGFICESKPNPCCCRGCCGHSSCD